MDNTDTNTRLQSPNLVAPRESDVVYGEEITFQWDAVDGASSYILEVATDARFSDIVLQEDVGDQTAVTVGGYFPTGNQSFFWRVLATDGEQSSGQRRIESFVAATEEDARRALGRPSEDMGPVTELVRAASADVSAKMLEPEGRFEQEKEMGVAYEGIAAGQIMSIAVSILLVIGIAVVILINWYNTTTGAQREDVSEAGAYLQLEELESQADQRLNTPGVVNGQDGIYRITIDDAMEQIANREYEAAQENIGESPVETGGAQE